MLPKNYGPSYSAIVEPYSSGESDDEDCLPEPTVNDVMQLIWDCNTIMIAKKLEEFPKEANPGLLITNIDNWANQNYIKQFIEETPSLT